MVQCAALLSFADQKSTDGGSGSCIVKSVIYQRHNV
jgi:hypothetical protein